MKYSCPGINESSYKDCAVSRATLIEIAEPRKSSGGYGRGEAAGGGWEERGPAAGGQEDPGGRGGQSGRGDRRDGAERGDVVRRAIDSVDYWDRETAVVLP